MSGAKRMRFRLPLLAVTAVVAIWAADACAQDSRIQVLERRLQEREKVILELLDRVETLERRIGVDRRARDAATAKGGNVSAARREPRPEGSADAAAAPGKVVVEEGAAERALERSLTRSGALLLRRGVLEAEPSFSYSRAEDSTPRFVTSGGVVFSGESERNADSLTADLALRLGLPWDSQLEVGIPYHLRTVETVTSVNFSPAGSSRDTAHGAGDLRVGLAKTLLRERLWQPDLVARLTWDTDTGDSDDHGVSLGGGFHELRGSLTAIKRQDPLAFVGGLSWQHGFENGAGVRPGYVASANFGSVVALSPETSLRFTLAGAYQTETEISGRAIDGSARTVGTFVVGGSTLLGRGMLLNLSAGIGLTDDADDFSFTVSLPIRFGTPLF